MVSSKPLSEWIQHMCKCGVSLCKGKGLVVITIIGKDTSSSSKMADIKTTLGGSYLDSWGQDYLNCGSIDAFFSFDLEAIFLVVNSYKDVSAFGGFPSSSNKEFFEWVEKENSETESRLTIAISLSHLVLVIENACRIELSLLQLLQNVNRKRVELRDLMSEGSRFNSENRFAVPRFIFAFHRHPIRKDLGNSKRKEVLEKLEQSLEDQVFSTFKHYKLLSTGAENGPEEALGHIWGEGYIHLIDKTSEAVTQHITSRLFSSLDGYTDEKEDNDQNMNRLLTFLNSHIKKVRDGKKLVIEIPSHERFMNAATNLLNAMESLQIEDEESNFMNKLNAHQMERAREKYMPSGTNLVLSRAEHEERLKSVFDFFSSTQVNPHDYLLIQESFEAIWSSDLRSCEYQSLLGNSCRLAAHASIGDGIDRERWTLHSSSVTHVSACNCGRSQIVRSDPFTLKEANFDFYSQFSCCERSMEIHKFKLAADESGRRLEVLTEEWPEVRVVGHIGESTVEEKEGEEDGSDREDEEEGDERDNIEDDEMQQTQNSREDHSEDETNYLEDVLEVSSAKDAQLTKAIHEFDTLSRLRSDGIPFIQGIPHLDAQDVRPLFPSWSLICIGTSSLYSHHSGIRQQFGFIGDTHLLPLDVYLEVDGSAWNRDMTYVESIIKSSSHLPSRTKRLRKGTVTERVKLFIGMEYECSAGHRQLSMGNMDDGIHLVENDLPLYQPCSYRKTPCGTAQMMRIHIITPKAPVTVSINPKIIASESSPVFYPGEHLDLSWSRYYILRLPWIYSGPNGVIPRPTSCHAGLLLSNSIAVSYTPLSNW